MAAPRSRIQTSGRPSIAIVGAGKLASALGPALRVAGYTICSLITRKGAISQSHVRQLAKKLESRVTSIHTSTPISADIVWLCVPDASIREVAQLLAGTPNWSGRIALHSSGALGSDQLASLKRAGATVGSVHPFMTFVKGSQPSLIGVPFALEGDKAAVQIARRIVSDLGGKSFPINQRDKVAYHAWGTFASPLLTALLATSEHVAAAARVPAKLARQRMQALLTQTLTNYVALGAAGGFSGPLVRGDVDIVKRHLRALRSVPEARQVYVALARAALRYLPTKKKNEMKKVLNSRTL